MKRCAWWPLLAAVCWVMGAGAVCEEKLSPHDQSFASFVSSARRGAFALGEVSSMEAVRPRDAFEARPAARLGVRLARNEYESVQLVVAAADGQGLQGVHVAVSGLRNAGGELFSAKNVSCSPVGYVLTMENPPYGIRPDLKPPACGWWPDMILDHVESVDIATNDVQSFWIRVHCPEGQAAGVYSGKLVVSAKGLPSVTLPFVVRVNDFSLPRTSMLPLAVSAGKPDADYKALGIDKKARNQILFATNGFHCGWMRHNDEYTDFFADYLLTFDSLYLNERNKINRSALKRLRAQGRLGLFNLGYWWCFTDAPGSEELWNGSAGTKLIDDNYAWAKAEGLLDHAYLYGCDELNANDFTNVNRTATALKKRCPGVPIMTTARDRRLGVDGSPLPEIDIHVPVARVWNPEQVEKSRAAGHQVWWYICCDPHAPYANFFIESPPIETRLLMGAMSAKFRPDGFLYYATMMWSTTNTVGETPFTKWNPCSYQTYHGDGSLVCCGPGERLLPTIRLENFRDGLEDYAYVKLLERARGQTVEVPEALVKSLTDFSIDPRALRAWRNRLADALEQRALHARSDE